MSELVEERGIGKRTTKFRLKDWGVSRQRYWELHLALHCENVEQLWKKMKISPVLLPSDIEFSVNGNP